MSMSRIFFCAVAAFLGVHGARGEEPRVPTDKIVVALAAGSEGAAAPTHMLALHAAALNDDADWAARLIARAIPVDQSDSRGRTALMVAAAFNSLAVARLLLDHGADLAAADRPGGNAPIHFAAAAGHVEMVALLVSRGADVDTPAKNGETPLHYAALYDHRGMIEDLVARGADVNASDSRGVRPLQYATSRFHATAVAMLRRHGARPDDLFDAVNAGDVARVQQLIARGSDVNAVDQFGTALHRAAATGQVFIATMLIDAGADIEAEGEPARSRPLHAAALNDEAGIAALLVARGADAEAGDAWGRTPVMVAAAHGGGAVAEVLLAGGARPDAQDVVYGNSPIHYAVLADDLDMVRLLLSHGADVNSASGRAGQPPLAYAGRKGSLRMIELLVERGADPNVRDNSGRTPIQAIGHRADAGEAIATLRRLGAL